MDEKWTARMEDGLKEDAEQYLEGNDMSKSELVRESVKSTIYGEYDEDLAEDMLEVHRLGAREEYDEAEEIVDKWYDSDIPEIGAVLDTYLHELRE